MTSRMVFGTVVGCVCVMAASAALAGPAVRSDVPAEAKWLVHFDFEAITNSKIGEGAMELITAEDSIVPEEKAKKAKKMWSKLEDVKSVTLYGFSLDKKDAVVIARLDYDKAEILEMLGIQSYGDHEIHSIGAKGQKCRKTDGQGKCPKTSQESRHKGHKVHSKGQKGFVCLYDDKTIVASGNRGGLEQALDLLDGEGKSLEPNQGLGRMLKADEGNFVVAAVEDLSKMVGTLQEKMGEKGRRHGALLKKCKSLRLELGEVNGEMVAKLDATLVSVEDAETALQATQGMLALGMLQMGEDERVVKLLQTVEIKQQGDKLAIQAQSPVEDILSEMRAKLK